MGGILSVAYLSGRFAKFSLIRRAAKEKKGVCRAVGFGIVVLLLAGLCAFLGTISGMIAVIHLVAIWLLCSGIGRLVKRKREWKKADDVIGICALAITAIYLTCGWFLAHHVWRTEYVIDTEKQVEPFRIVMFADSHIGTTFHKEGFAKQVAAMQSEHPDAVVIVGDFVDDDTSKEDMLAACQALGTLETTYGVYYVSGNHDRGYYGPEYRGYSGEELFEELEKNHVTVLQDETVLLGGSFYLIGRRDRFEGQRATMDELVSELDPQKFSIVLDHQPYDYDAQEKAGVDLVLSGHTHGGQLFPFHRMGQWLGVDAKSYGQEQRGKTNFIVTSGISDWAIQFKTGCKSEYVVIDVK